MKKAGCTTCTTVWAAASGSSIKKPSLLRDVVTRDGLTVFAWALLPNHFHLAFRTGVVSLDRPMWSLQQRVTRAVNLRRRVYRPLWQGRYKAKLVRDQHYLDQLLIYIHPNPVTARIVDDPAEYRRSGHREFLGKVKDLAGQLRKSPDGISQTLARAARRRTEDTAFRLELTRLDRAMADRRARRPGRIAE